MPGNDVLDHRVQNHWHVNDERYVRRGESTAVDAADWRRSLTRVNKKRRGRPFVLPPAMLASLRAMIIEMRISYRAAEGHLRRMLSALDMKAPDHTTIWKRLAALRAVPAAPPRQGVIVAVDSTGFSTTLRNEWMRDHWHKHRGFVKAHVMIDVETLEVLVVVVTDDTVSDGRAFASLIEQALERGVVVRRVLADGAYDMRENFDILDANGIETGIRIRRGASKRLMGGTLARPRAVQELDRIGFEAWASKYEYSLRWMIEYVFSAVKRTIGGEVRSRRRDLMFSEVENKFWTWNAMRRADLCN